MYKFQNNPEDQQELVDQAVQSASDPAATPATPEAPKSVQEMLKDRLASQLDPSMQQRYKDRQAQAVAQQTASYQGPEAIQALKDGQDFRTLQTGLQSAANKFGSVGGDGGQKSDFGSIAKSFDDSAKQQFDQKDAAFKHAQTAEDKAVDEGFKTGIARPLATQEGINTLNNSDREAKQNAILDPLKIDNAQTANAASKLDFQNKDALNDPTSPESAQLREFAKQYPQLKVTDATTGAQLNSLIPLVEKKYQIDEQRAGRLDTAKARAEANQANAQARADTLAEKTATAKEKANIGRFDAFGKTMEADIGRSGNYGKASQTINAANQAQTLLEQTKGNPSPQQMFEIAKSVDALVSGGSGTTVNGTSHMLPESAMGDVNKFKNYLTGIPGGAGQQEFAKQLAETIEREKKLAEDRKNAITSRVATRYHDLRGADKDKWDSFVSSQGLDPEDFDEKGQYKSKAAGSKSKEAQPNRTTLQSADDLP